jgi:uncharacterized protein YecE (DUF72 family)
MHAYVGTSGWSYSWNPTHSLDWYVSKSGLNAIELNASFYRFPFPNQIKHWLTIGKELSWSVKVNRLITHQYKLSPASYSILQKFLLLFKPLDEHIRYFLFQLPPSITPNIIGNVEAMLEKFQIKDKFALEPRSTKWFNKDVYSKLRKLGITFVSTDSPIGTYIEKTSSSVYLRLHGRTDWYRYRYSNHEIKDLLSKVLEKKPKELHVFFNNDHNMLGNAQTALRLCKQ